MGRIIAWLFSTEALVRRYRHDAGHGDKPRCAGASHHYIVHRHCFVVRREKAYQNSKPIIIASLSSFVVMGGLTYYVIGPFADYYFGLNPFIAWALLDLSSAVRLWRSSSRSINHRSYRLLLNPMTHKK